MSSSAIDQHKISTPGKTSEVVEAAIEQAPNRPPPAGGATSSQNETAPSDNVVTTIYPFGLNIKLKTRKNT
ncbi:unnamed protein product [Rotaria sordida]|uniref:Uncharacterized protein n=1 Tax=Rotaria sordida TaxID=392033 RepID=A0A815CSC7_9BILA|nr:unnamed protein product [Rotaria sordida]CAF1306724.1 unnamed protein product [Rotaria sordida]CAF3952133.1 unnamed protein product [Rotaria sordida]CAF4095101.1 unnamed protein product [Rotaria sordida]